MTHDFVLSPPHVRDWLLAKLSRVTTSGEVIREIDGFRFLAISSVILHHLLAIYLESTHRFEIPKQGWQALKESSYVIWLISPGWFGVHLFFVISGFVLGLPFARHYLYGVPVQNLTSYYLRRVSRIEPPYVISLVVCLLFLSFKTTNWHSYLPHFFASLFYSHNIVYGEMSHIESIFWSLEVEIQFYLVAPFLALLFTIRNNWLRPSVLAGLIMLSGYLMPRWFCVYSMRSSLSIVCSLQYFLAGFLLVEIYLSKLVHPAPTSYIWDLVAAGAAISMFILLDRFWAWWWMLPFTVVLLYVSLFRGRLGNRFVTLPPVFIIGGMCYTLYLYHVLVIKQFGRLTFALWSPELPLAVDLLIQFLLLGPIILVIGALLFYSIEKPFMKMRFRYEPQG